MLAEASTTEISKKKKPKNLKENKNVARKGGKVANVARKQLENDTGKDVVSPLNARKIQKKLDENNKEIEE